MNALRNKKRDVLTSSNVSTEMAVGLRRSRKGLVDYKMHGVPKTPHVTDRREQAARMHRR
jgi:hypothetical protein